MREIAALFEDLELQLIKSLKRNLARHKAWEKDERFSKNGAPAGEPQSGLSWGSDGTAERSEGPATAGPERSAARDGAAWQAEKLRHLWRFRRENAAILREYAGKIDAETRALLKEQFAESADPEMPDKAFFGVNGKKLDALIDEITHNEQRVERACLRYMDDIYRKTILRAATVFNAGGATMQQPPHTPAGAAECRSDCIRQAIDMATRDFLERGINCIQYRDGRMVNIATYVEMALRTCNTRAMLLGEAQRREELGIDTVLVSQYGGCSETCLPWQGLVYIDDVWQAPHHPAGSAEARSDWPRQPYHGENNRYMGGSYGRSRNGRSYPMLSVAVKAGLFHPNCRHHLTTWIEGISKRPEPMDKAEVERIAKLEKQQRALERRVRKYKRLAAGTLDPEKVKEYRAKVKDAQKAVREFVEQYGDVLRRDYWRERNDGSGNQLKSFRQNGTTPETNARRPLASNLLPDVQSGPQKGLDNLTEDDRLSEKRFVHASAWTQNQEQKQNDIVTAATGKVKGVPMSIYDAAVGANPRYNNGYEYQINCQRCVQAYEFRRRGYDVIAKGAKEEDDTIDWGSECFVPAGSNAHDAYRFNLSEMELKYKLETAPDGARFSVYIKWDPSNPGAHVYIAEKENGFVRYIDPQIGNTNVCDIFDLGEEGRYGFFRLDDKPVTIDVDMIKNVVEAVTS